MSFDFPTPQPATILIVDDTPTNLQVLGEYLTGAGLDIRVAEDGTTALEQVQLAKPDIILLDIMMPGMDGYETCTRLKENAETRDIPILFMSALSETKDKIKGFSIGGVDYITKPFQQEEVLARVNAHLTIRRLQAELQAQLALRDKFMQIASHDLRNPLCAISAMCDLVLSGNDDQPPPTKWFSHIRSGVTQMQRIIGNFLERSQPREEQMLPSGGFDLNRLIIEVVARNNSMAKRKQIELRPRLKADLPLVHGSASLMDQVISNYITNAMKFSAAGTTVVVRTRPVGANVRVEVDDQGPGVPPEERSQLFQEYATISNKPTAGEGSTGLGLSIVKRLVEGMGGSVGAEFPEQGGSVFWLEIPQASSIQAQAA